MGIMSCRKFLLIIRKGGNLLEVSRLCRALAVKTTLGVVPLRCSYPHLLTQRYDFFVIWARGNPYLCVGKSLFVSREIPTARREIPILVAPATAAKDQRPTTKPDNRSGNVVNPPIRRASYKAVHGRGALPPAERWRAPRALHRRKKSADLTASWLFKNLNLIMKLRNIIEVVVSSRVE